MSERRGLYTVAETPVSITLTREELATVVAELHAGARHWNSVALGMGVRGEEDLLRHAGDQARRLRELAGKLTRELVGDLDGGSGETS